MIGTLGSQSSAGAAGSKMAKSSRPFAIGQPKQTAKVRDHCRRRGLAGASAAATLANSATSEMFLFSGFAAARARIAAQGGINAAKNYQNDGDSVFRLFYDTIKGGDFRAREANVYRLAEVAEHYRSMRGAGRAVRA